MFAGKNSFTVGHEWTFMFGEDRFGSSEDFSVHYAKIGGKLAPAKINGLVRGMYEYLDARYIDGKYRHTFPSVEQALSETSDEIFDDDEIQRIVATFAHHELGCIPAPYAHALHKLKQRFVLGAVIDIWAAEGSLGRCF